MGIRAFLCFVTLALVCVAWPAAADPTTAYCTIDNDYGEVSIRATFPDTSSARYSIGGDAKAPVVINVPPMFTVEWPANHFYKVDPNFELEGFIHVSYLLPGYTTHEGDDDDSATEGNYDAGSTRSIAATKDVINFVTGTGGAENTRGQTFVQWTDAVVEDLVALTSNVGLFAFSNPGILVTSVLSGWYNANIAWYVGGENPTEDVIIERDVGYTNGGTEYPSDYYWHTDYDSTDIGGNLDYTDVTWVEDDTICLDWEECPVWSDGINDDYVQDTPPVLYIADSSVHRFFSTPMSDRLDSLSPPNNVATGTEAATFWASRQSTAHYSSIHASYASSETLHVMLIFYETDHKQPATDKPHIHQAWDGFYDTAGLWTKLNASKCYAVDFVPGLSTNYPQHDANTEPASDWLNASIENHWSWPGDAEAGGGIAAMAGVCEMADRQQDANWDDDLPNVICARASLPCTP